MIAKGNESKEAVEFKRYIGVVPVCIESINPDKLTHEKLFNTVLEDAPNYLGTRSDETGKEFTTVRITIVARPVVDFDMSLVTVSFFLEDRPRYNREKTKVQVIDKYGRTGWVPVEYVADHKIPSDKNGNLLNLDPDYRPAFVGEEDLMAFVKEYLWIDSLTMWDSQNRKWVINPKINPANCECRFDNLEKIFKNDFTEIKEALGYQPTNKVKVMLGIRTDIQSGRLYQTVYTKKFLRSSSNNLNVFAKEISDMAQMAAQSGRIPNTEYEAVPIHEYSIKATSFAPNVNEVSVAPTIQEEDSDLPF